MEIHVGPSLVTTHKLEKGINIGCQPEFNIAHTLVHFQVPALQRLWLVAKQQPRANTLIVYIVVHAIVLGEQNEGHREIKMDISQPLDTCMHWAKKKNSHEKRTHFFGLLEQPPLETREKGTQLK